MKPTDTGMVVKHTAIPPTHQLTVTFRGWKLPVLFFGASIIMGAFARIGWELFGVFMVHINPG